MVIDIVIPVRNNLELTQSICQQVAEQQGWRHCLIFDNGSTDKTGKYLSDLAYVESDFRPFNAPGLTIYEMWNKGFEYSKMNGSDAVLFLNNDIQMAEDTIWYMTQVLKTRPQTSLVYPDYTKSLSEEIQTFGIKATRGTYRHGGMSGFCFMLRTAAVTWSPLVDERFKTWYGDDDIAFNVQKHGGEQIRITGLPVDHIGQATCNQFPEVFAEVPSDKIYFESKWGKGK